MGFSRQAGANVVPLLSRLVLAAAFIPAGWEKIMGEETVYEGQDAAILQRLGVGQPVSGSKEVSLGLVPGIVLASYQQDVETGSLVPNRRPRPPQDEPIVIPVPEPPAPEPVVESPRRSAPPVMDQGGFSQEDAGGTGMQARRLHRVTIMLVDAGWPEKLKPDWMGWAAAGTELIGGSLILLGLFSRLWGIGLAITMGIAFYLTSLGAVTEYGILNLPVPEFNQVFTQIALFAMAFGVFLTGAGAFSMDRMLFRGGDDDDEHLLHLG